LILLALSLLAFAQEGPSDSASSSAKVPRLQTGKVLSVEKHGEGRAFDWVRGGLALIPVYDHYPFYDITIQWGGKNYVVRYETQTDYYPAAWKPGSPIEARLGHGRLYLLRYDGVEVSASIVHESAVRR
jgi:hypothetical protein